MQNVLRKNNLVRHGLAAYTLKTFHYMNMNVHENMQKELKNKHWQDICFYLETNYRRTILVLEALLGKLYENI